MSARILVLPGGRPVRASDPCPGSMHDVAAPGAFRAAGGNRSLRVDRRQGLYRKGNDHAPQEAPQRRIERGGEGGQQEHQANKSINKIRQVVERAIAHIKSWRIHPHRLPAPPAHIREDHHRRPHSLHAFKTTL